MKARSLRALLLASSLILSVGTTAMPIMAVNIAPDTSDSGISIDADDGVMFYSLQVAILLNLLVEWGIDDRYNI